MPKITQSFFARPTLIVAKLLIGKELVCNNKSVIITETEAYVGEGDPACHAAKGRTKRNDVMFGEAGLVYVYLIYGMYYCLNIVTEEGGYPAAVLIRGGVDLGNISQKLDGPGKLCRYLNIDKNYNYLDCTSSPELFFNDSNYKLPVNQTPRIGISQGLDKLWRYVVPKEALSEIAILGNKKYV